MEIPEHLPEENREKQLPATRELMENVVKVLQEAGIGIKPMDLYAIEMMVTQLQRARQAGAHVDQYGILVQKVSGDIGASPHLKAERDAAAMFLRYAEHMGLTLASRLRLGLMTLQGRTMTEALAADLESE